MASLGELLKDSATGSAADWVKRNRQVVAIKESRAARQQKDVAAAAAAAAAQRSVAYASKDLAGLKVQHSADAFKEGESVILTMKDSHILDEKGELAEADDELENVQVAELERAEEFKDRKRKLGKPIYSNYDDEETEAGGGKRILAQYDDEVKKGPGLILTGEVPPPVQKPRFVERPAADADDDSALALLQKRSAASATHKPKRKHMRTKKEARSTAEILSALQKHREAADAEDGEVAVKEEGEPDLKRKKGTVVAGQRILGSTKRVETTGDVVDDDADLVASLARARRVAQKSNAMADDDEDQSDLGAQRIRAMIKSSAAADARKAAEPVTGLVLTDTVEFSRMLETRMLEKALVKAHDAEVAVAAASASAAAKATAAGAASAAGAGDVAGGDDSGDDDGVAAGGDVDMEEGEEVEQADDEQAKGSGSDDDDKQGAFEEINVGSGLASTLALLRRQGDLFAEEVYVGRAKDKKPEWERKADKDAGSGVKLEYRDAHGRKLTPKEAFRQQSYVFHGRKPGKMKREKRAKELEMQSSADRLSTLQALQLQHNSRGQAYVVLNKTS